MSKPPPSPHAPPRPTAASRRTERLEVALRDNLRKRKEQARERKAALDDEPPASGG